MALAFTEPIKLGYKAPDFELLEPLSGKLTKLNDVKGEQATVVMFICNHCPYVIHVNEGLIALANDYKDKGVAFVAISSNNVDDYPQDSPDKMAFVARDLQYPFPYLYDETQSVAKAFHAMCTPDFSIFDNALKCVYRGQLDDSRPNSNIQVSGRDIREALDQIIKDKPLIIDQIPSAGCSIKWKS